MRDIYELRMPRTIIYGERSFTKVGEQALRFGKKCLVVSDKVMVDLGYVKMCIHYLEKVGIECLSYVDIETEPTDKYVKEALDIVKKEQCDIIIALGGGSCIDTAKAVAVLATNRDDISDYMNNKKLVNNAPLPLIAIPTTAGTGSEATDVTVITNTTNNVKMMIKQPAFMPEVAIVDPILTVSSPKSITAATGLDALTHALEAYISKKAHPFTNQLALSAIKLIVENIFEAYHNGKNINARNNMIYASMLAGIAFSNSSVCLVHGMSRPIGAIFHVPHGISNAMLLPVILKYTQSSCINRLAEIGRFLYPHYSNLKDEELSQKVVSTIIGLCEGLNIKNIESWGINEAEYNKVLVKMAKDALISGSPANNPRVPTEDEIIDLYREAFIFEYPSVKEGTP